MRQFMEPVRCYEATITQDGRTTTIVHRCADSKCPDNN